MRICVVGSGTLLPDPDRGSPAHWVACGDSSVLLDCGAGTLRTLARLGLDWRALSHLVFTHFHTDHVGELAPLLFALKHGLDAPRERPLRILGPRGLSAHLEGLARTHGSFILDPGFPVVARELTSGQEWEAEGGDFRIRTAGTRHTEHSLALRVEAGEGALGYTGDTGPEPGLGPFFHGCQVLLAECSNPESQAMDIHLTPKRLAALAVAAAPRLLIPVHSYPPLEPGRLPELLADAGYGGWVLPGRDGLCVDLRAGRVEAVHPEDST